MSTTPKNMCLFTGRLTRDVELAYTSKGNPKLTLDVAVNGRRKNAEGNWEDDVTYVRLVYFIGAERAEKLTRLLRKGTMVQASSTYKCDRVRQDDGTYKYYHNFYVNILEILLYAPEGDSAESASGWPAGDVADEDIPF